MTKFAIRTQATGYGMKPGDEVLAVELDGGAPRMRKDKLNSSNRVSVTWTLNEEQYNYLWAFYRTTVANGSLPFTIDLLMDSTGLKTCTARFVPSTLALTGQAGRTYTVSADLYVEPVTRSSSADNALVEAFNARYGA